LAILGLVCGGRPAAAQWTVYDPINYAENVLHYTHQLLQIQYQLQQLGYQVQALAKLPAAPFRDVRAPLSGIAALMGAPRSLGYAAPDVAATFHTLFPVSRPVDDWPVEQQARAQSSIDVLQAAVLATAEQQATVGTGSETLARMKELNSVVQGHEQALELQNTAAVYSAEELMLLRQAAMAQTNIQAVFYANEMNTVVQRDATVRAVLGALVTPPTVAATTSLRVNP
jgi:P-type conjugative transfer protein TrbJ